ncbi:MAG: hypothetical protein Q4B50_02840 [Bacillota bacterium]|nr:hypothetical protein [Bacillota bacterium]
MMKKYFTLFSLLVFLLAGLWAAANLVELGPTYDGSDTDVTELYDDPQDYDVSDPDGVADIIVQEDLALTNSTNAVTAVVFDFRGYDTMGEAFILITAIAGSMAILRKAKKGGAANGQQKAD